jgi:hypothetical protein
MALNPWIVSDDILQLIRKIQNKHHSSRLANASIAAVFEDSKPFVKNKINLGKVCKFTPFAKLWQTQKHDFCVVIPSELWVSVLNDEGREAYLDLQLTRCEVEYEPELDDDKKKVKDDWGRVKYTDKMKTDDEGTPKWKVVPLDLEVFTKNVRRYGPWLEELLELNKAIDQTKALHGSNV